MDNLFKSYFNFELGNGGVKYLEGVYVVVFNLKIGVVLFMLGLKYDLKMGDLIFDFLGIVINVFVLGFVVKAVIISFGWENGVLLGN